MVLGFCFCGFFFSFLKLNLSITQKEFLVSDLIIEPSSVKEICNNLSANLLINLSIFSL